MEFERFLDKSVIPTDEAIKQALGPAVVYWQDLCAYIHGRYIFHEEMIYFTKKYGWAIRYRKGGKTLCYLFPETDAFSMLIVLGMTEAERAELIADKLNEPVRRVLQTTKQLHDGRWLWLRAINDSDVMSMQLLLAVKMKPKIT